MVIGRRGDDIAPPLVRDFVDAHQIREEELVSVG
jgi:hypothetical protein